MTIKILLRLCEALAFALVLGVMFTIGLRLSLIGIQLPRGVSFGLMIKHVWFILLAGGVIQYWLAFWIPAKRALLIALCVIGPVLVFLFPMPNLNLNENQVQDQSWRAFLGSSIGGILAMLLFAQWRVIIAKKQAAKIRR